MPTPPKPVQDALGEFNEALDDIFGADGVQPSDAARRTAKDEETIRNYRRGYTFPTIAWLLHFTFLYRGLYPARFARLWRAFDGIARAEGQLDRSTLDADGDGRIGRADVDLHGRHAIVAIADPDRPDFDEAEWRVRAARECAKAHG